MTAMTLADYRIDTGVFGGPMDLLLHLVRRHELDICRISLARITAEFNEQLMVLQLLDLDLVGDFIVVASTLLEIKSREVLPVPESEADDEIEDELAGSELIQRLLDYKRFKNAAGVLDNRAAQWLERYPRLSDDRPASTGTRVPDRVRGVEIWDLVSALARIVRIPSAVEHTTIRMDETPMAVHQERIRRRLTGQDRAAFSSFFEGERNQSRIVGIFQAILELIRHEQYRAVQETGGGEIWVLPPASAPALEIS
jgi:segregation and condensation protein A